MRLLVKFIQWWGYFKYYGVSKNSLSTWVKNEKKTSWIFQQSKVAVKWNKLWVEAYNVDRAVFKWSDSKWSQEIEGPTFKEMAKDFVKALNKPD